MHLIVGLGNPGRDYIYTRHNIGFNIIDYLASLYLIDIKKSEGKALTGRGIIQGEKVLLAKPQTFMNNSGISVRELSEYYKIPVNKIIVVYDDVDIPIGKIRIRPQGSAGTHNGMRSIVYHIKDDNFPRVRIGIDKPKNSMDIAAYVIGKFTKEEIELIDSIYKKASLAITTIIENGCNIAMSKYNG